MQLMKRHIRRSLGMVTANLFMATHGYADTVVTQEPATTADNASSDQSAYGLSSTTLDSSVMYYREHGGRVKALEPVARLTVSGNDGSVFTATVIYDSLSGASPNGATPWNATQTFITPAPAPSTSYSVTGASGGRTIVTLPGTSTQVAEYTTPAHQLPVDPGFHDRRSAIQLGYSEKWNPVTNVSVGIASSREHDYSSWSGNASIARDFNDHNTTARIGLSYEHDNSFPIFGTPTPLTLMNGVQKGPSETKTVTSLITGVTQDMNRHWLLQANYEIGWNRGYQTDPYKIVSVINPTTGGPMEYRYESRPQRRVRQSFYIANKVAIGPTAADISFRYYHDSWGIRSLTGDVSERIPLTTNLYVQPEFYYYKQSAADFFDYYLLNGQPLPQYASADGRLAKFSARTIGIRVGYTLSPNTNLYLLAEDYKQMGRHHLPYAPGDLATEDIFSGVHATSIVAGFTYRFNASPDED